MRAGARDYCLFRRLARSAGVPIPTPRFRSFGSPSIAPITFPANTTTHEHRFQTRCHHPTPHRLQMLPAIPSSPCSQSPKHVHLPSLRPSSSPATPSTLPPSSDTATVALRVAIARIPCDEVIVPDSFPTYVLPTASDLFSRSHHTQSSLCPSHFTISGFQIQPPLILTIHADSSSRTLVVRTLCVHILRHTAKQPCPPHGSPRASAQSFKRGFTRSQRRASADERCRDRLRSS
jgi:hypothetical protein